MPSNFVVFCLQSKDICIQLQDGLLKVTTELQTVSVKTTTQNTFLYNTNKAKCDCLYLYAGMADILPVPLRVCVCRGETEGGRETRRKAEAECCQETGAVDRESK